MSEKTVTIPVEPTEGVLMSMAIRSDHGLGVPGYYDMFGEGEHKKRLESALVNMRQLYEEVAGQGFFSPELEERYVRAMRGGGA